MPCFTPGSSWLLVWHGRQILIKGELFYHARRYVAKTTHTNKCIIYTEVIHTFISVYMTGSPLFHCGKKLVGVLWYRYSISEEPTYEFLYIFPVSIFDFTLNIILASIRGLKLKLMLTIRLFHRHPNLFMIICRSPDSLIHFYWSIISKTWAESICPVVE